MKSICFVVTSPFTVNGFLIGHLTELKRHYHVSLCINLDQYQISPKLDTSNIRIIHVPLERKISPLRDFKAWVILFRIFCNSQFISVHSITPKAGLIGMSAAFFARIPNRIHTFTGQVWVTRSGLSRTIFKRVDWLIAKFATFVFADSTSQIQFLLKEGVCNSQHIALLGSGSISGVDLDRFHPNQSVREKVRFELLAGKEDCVFLFVGRLCRDKGVFDLLHAFSRLIVKHQNAILWIVGPDEEGVAHQVKEHSPEFYDLVKWIGPTFTPEIYMVAADVLLLPSYREGFGSVIIEAAACSLPTIAYRIDGVVDAVADGKTGVLVDVGDVQELQDKMQYLLSDHNLRSIMGNQARSRAFSDFSSVSVTRAWLEFYQSVIK